MLNASLPDPGSVRQNAAIISPVASLGSHLRFCASVPKRSRPLNPMDECAPRVTATEPSQVATSSMTRAYPVFDSPRPPYSCGTINPKSPRSRSDWSSSAGISPVRSRRAVSMPDMYLPVAATSSRTDSRESSSICGYGNSWSSRMSPKKSDFPKLACGSKGMREV